MGTQDAIHGSSADNKHDYGQAAKDAQHDAGNYQGDIQSQIDGLKEKTEFLVSTHVHDGNNAPLINLNTDINGLFEVVSSVPANVPSNVYDQIKIYESGGTHRLYWYDNVARAWRYTAGT